MERKTPCSQAHPASGKEVVPMDDVDVDVDVTRACLPCLRSGRKDEQR